jgi:hypothetical protein
MGGADGFDTQPFTDKSASCLNPLPVPIPYAFPLPNSHAVLQSIWKRNHKKLPEK